MIDLKQYWAKVPQSVLLSGGVFTEVSAFAEQWAANILQTSCETVRQHPNFRALYPVNRMRQISVDALRALIHWVYTSAQGNKVCMIYEADRLNLAAANALLKVLEEPAEHTSIFLLTQRPYDLLPTVRSRCWWVQLPSDGALASSDNVLQGCLTDLSQYVTDYLEQGVPLDPLKVYGLLYRFQGYLNHQIEQVEVEGTLLEAEEKVGQQARMEKQWVQQLFTEVERTLNAWVHEHALSALGRVRYAQWVSDLEKAYRRTEVNFGAIASLESFLLTLCV